MVVHPSFIDTEISSLVQRFVVAHTFDGIKIVSVFDVSFCLYTQKALKLPWKVTLFYLWLL